MLFEIIGLGLYWIVKDQYQIHALSFNVNTSYSLFP